MTEEEFRSKDTRTQGQQEETRSEDQKEEHLEQSMYQTICNTYKAPDVFQRCGTPTSDLEQAKAHAVDAIVKTHDVQSSFVVRVEAAYMRENPSVKKVI